MDQGHSVKIIFFGLILCVSLDTLTFDDAPRYRKRARTCSGDRGDTVKVSNSLTGDERSGSRSQMPESLSQYTSFAELSSTDSSRSSSPAPSSQESEWDCDTTLPVIGYAPAIMMHQRGGVLVREQYNALLEGQRSELLRRFCEIIYKRRDDSRLSEHMHRYRAGVRFALPPYEHSSRLQRLGREDVCAQVSRELPRESFRVSESSDQYPGDSNILLAVFGQNIKIYPGFFRVSLLKQLAEVRIMIENIRANNPFLIDVMHRCISENQHALSEIDLAKARSLFQEVCYFCTRSAVVRSFFTEINDDVRAFLMQSGKDAPIDYMKELVGHVEQEEEVQWGWLIQPDQLATSWQNNTAIVDEYPGIPTGWAIKVIVARGQYRMRQRDMERAKKDMALAEKARQELLAQQLAAANAVKKKRAPRAKK